MEGINLQAVIASLQTIGFLDGSKLVDHEVRLMEVLKHVSESVPKLTPKCKLLAMIFSEGILPDPDKISAII